MQYFAVLTEVVLDSLGVSLKSIERVGGGRNSRVYKLCCHGSKNYIVKLYFHHPSDSRNRLQLEYDAYQFLWRNGIRCIPQPLGKSEKHNCAIYEYIDGRKLLPEEVGAPDIDDLVCFLTTLKSLKNRKESLTLPLASEAFFSMREIVVNIDQRLTRLQKGAQDNKELMRFLEDGFIPQFKEIEKAGKCFFIESSMSWQDPIDNSRKTLSPSDFGYHNALKCTQGKTVYLDFEYFGWDDPAKMISDFLLHPGMSISEENKQLFFNEVMKAFEDDAMLLQRIRMCYSLFSLKWSMILLNEFLPEHSQRRNFAKKNCIDDKILSAQLLKSKNMLKKASIEFKEFPYCRA